MATRTAGATNNVQRKLALLIGIAEYEFPDQMAALPNTASDVDDMSFALWSIDFIITKKLHLKRREMKNTLNDFEDSIQPGDIVLFYFTGHGIQWEGQNYLIPTDFPEMNVRNLNRTAINAQDILNTLSAREPFAIIFLLDCYISHHLCNPDLSNCATNTIDHKSADLKPMHKAGSLIAFSCSPVTTAIDSRQQRNGLFSKHLRKHITAANKDIGVIIMEVQREVMQESNLQQIPFVDDGLLGMNIYLYGRPLETALRVSSINIPRNARWKKNGITVAGGNEAGSRMDQLSSPFGLCFDEDQTIYIADSNNRRVMEWRHGATSGKVVVSGNGGGDGIHQLSYPLDVIVDKAKDSIIISDRGSGSLVRWPRQNGDGIDESNSPESENWMSRKKSKIYSFFGWKKQKVFNGHSFSNYFCKPPPASLQTVIHSPQASNRRVDTASGEAVVSNIDCIGLTMDEDGFLYAVDGGKHEVRRYRMNDNNNGILVAGGDRRGRGLHQLSFPWYVFVDRDRSVYVSDAGNHRVVKWKEGAKEGIVVAGGNGHGSSLTKLSGPLGVFVDQLGTVYVADSGNNRVMRWTKGSTQGTVIAGGNGEGKQSDQLNGPVALSFDRHGNLFVTDHVNNRVQKFEIEVDMEQNQTSRL